MNKPLPRFSSSPPRLRRRWQGGSIVVNTAIAMSLIVILLIGTELGFLFYTKREFQKAVDLAAIAGAQAMEAGDCAAAKSAAVSSAGHNLPANFQLTAADIICGRWDPLGRPAPLHFSPSAGSEIDNAVYIVFSRTPTLLLPGIPGNEARQIQVQALAAQRTPRAALNIRSSLATVDSARSTLLNSLMGGLLGGSLNIDAVGWNGLVNADLQLLSFLDQLAIDLGISAGNYDHVLAAQVSVGTVLQAAITALEHQGPAVQVAVDALKIVQLSASAAPNLPLMQLGSLLGIQGGTDAAGLVAHLQVFQLVEGLIQLANQQSGLVASIPISLMGGATVAVHVKVIEAPRLSATGDPRLARLDPDGPNRIYVRSAQVRTLVSVDLPALNGLSSLLGAVTTALSPVTTLLNDVLSLNLSLVGDLLSCAVACTKNATDIDILPPPLRLDINLDVGGGEARLTDFSCATDAVSVTASTTTQAAALRIGKMGQTAALARTQVFSSSLSPHVDPVPVVDVGSISCTKALFGLVVSCSEASRQAFAGGGLGLKSDVPVAASTQTQFFADPPRLDEEPVYAAIATSNIVQSLSNTLSGLDLLQGVAPTSASGGGLSAVMAGLTSALSNLISLLRSIVSATLAPLLDPLLNTLIRDTLGINLAQTEVGARMNCASGAELVY